MLLLLLLLAPVDGVQVPLESSNYEFNHEPGTTTTATTITTTAQPTTTQPSKISYVPISGPRVPTIGTPYQMYLPRAYNQFVDVPEQPKGTVYRYYVSSNHTTPPVQIGQSIGSYGAPRSGYSQPIPSSYIRPSPVQPNPYIRPQTYNSYAQPAPVLPNPWPNSYIRPNPVQPNPWPNPYIRPNPAQPNPYIRPNRVQPNFVKSQPNPYQPYNSYVQPRPNPTQPNPYYIPKPSPQNSYPLPPKPATYVPQPKPRVQTQVPASFATDSGTAVSMPQLGRPIYAQFDASWIPSEGEAFFP